MNRRRLARITAVSAGVLLVLVAIGVGILTMTDFGRERMRLFSLGELTKRIHGHVEIGDVHGNLLSGATLENVTITDSAGGAFLRADTLQFKYSIRSLFQKHLVFTDVRLVRPVVVFDRRPGGEWNVKRIFPGDTVAVPGDTVPGFGDWVRIEDLTVVDGTVTVKRPWTPDGQGGGDERPVAEAVSPDTREMVASAPGGGFQAISSFHRLDGAFPLLRLADPDSAARIVEVDSLSMLALPFRPPAATVRNLTGRLTIIRGTLGFHDVDLVLPSTTLSLDGAYGFSGEEEVGLRLRGDPVSLADLRWLRPSLPEGSGTFDLAVGREDGRTRLVARDVDLRVEGGRLRGFAEVATGDGGTRLSRSDLRFEALDTRTIERLAQVDVPLDGTVAGQLELAGTEDELEVDGWATVRERDGITSRIEADGVVMNRPEGVVARNLELRFDPLHLSLAHELRPDLTLGGQLSGRATLDGPLEGSFTLDADVVHLSAGTGRSRLVAQGGLRLADGVAARDLRVRMEPLQTELVREFEPDFPVGGVITGRATLDGVLASAMTVDAEIVHESPRTGRSRIAAEGGVRWEGGLEAQDLRMRFDPLQSELVRVIEPDFPLGGAVSGRATLDGELAEALTVDADLVHDGPPPVGRSRVMARGEIRFEGRLAARDLDLRFEPLQSELVRVLAPEFPLGGAVSGRATLDGVFAEVLTVDADLVHEGPPGSQVGRSHVIARGGLRVQGGLAARDLDLRVDPLRLELVRAFAPDFPLRGTLEGRGVLNGSASGRLAASGLDLTHRGPEGTSVLAGDLTVNLAAADPTYDVDLRVDPLSLATVHRFAPAAGLHGSVRGRITAQGTLSRADLDLDLDVAGGGHLVARGTIGVGATARYDVRTVLTDFDASAVTTRAPATALTGFVDVEGVGTELATADATIDARLVDSRLERTPRADSTRVRARLDDGLAVFEQGHIRLATATADVEGSFGLVAGRSGRLRYSVTVDSLSRFAALLPADTGVVEPRPLPRILDMAAARADSAREAEDRLVEALATGEPLPGVALDSGPPLSLDSGPPLPLDSVSGSLRTEGVLTGNVTRFDATGSAVLNDVVYGGAAVGAGDLEYTATDVRTDFVSLAVEGDMESVRVAGFAFDDATLDVVHRGGLDSGEGRARIAVTQDRDREYEVRAGYELALDRKVLRLEAMALRFDTTTWTSTRPGVVRWAGRGVAVEHIELTSDRGGRIFADGVLSDGGLGALRLQVDSLPVSHIAGLLQDTLDTRGLLSLDARVTGSLSAPVARGTLRVDDLERGGSRISSLRADFDWVDGELTARTEVMDEGRTLLEGDIRLALDSEQGFRFMDGPISADLSLDSLPLEVLPFFPDVVEDVVGRLRGDLTVRGTLSEPELGGDLELELFSAHLPDPSLTLTDGFGAFRLRGDRIFVDSLVADVEGGPARVTGTIDLVTLDRPELDLELTARDARVLDDERGNARADLDLRITGPLTALRVRGDAHVQSGEIQVPEPEEYGRVTDLSDPVLVRVLDTLGVAEELRPGKGFLERVDLDVAVRVDRDTWLRNSALHVEIYTPSNHPALRVRSAQGDRSVSLEGVVNTDRGEYTVAGRVLELNSGSVSFLGRKDPDPLLQLNAQHEVPRRGHETLVILINVGGYLSSPRLALSSNAQPPLPESDLISYLAFGQQSSSLLASEGSGLMGESLGGLGVLAEQQLAGLGLGALTESLISSLERQGAETGLDVFRVHPGALPDELNYGDYFGNVFRGIEIEAGEYLGERFFVMARARPTGRTLPGVQLEYRTPRGFSWVTTWDLRFLPSRPTLGMVDPSRSRVFGSFLLWSRRF